MGKKLDTRAIGLDVGLELTRWLTGAENLHYGLWTGLEVRAANVGAAQAAYTDKLFGLLPEGGLRILDIGGGAGETAKKLLALGHSVDIVVPSPFLAGRCRENAPAARVHEATFEDFETDERFDLCLFSESFQYIDLYVALEKAAKLAAGGHVLISDNFRTNQGNVLEGNLRKVGSGHGWGSWEVALAGRPDLTVISQEDITEAVAPSVEVEQDFFLVFGHALTRIDAELMAKRPKARWMMEKALRLVTSQKWRDRMMQRLTQRTRTAEAFKAYNQYMMIKLKVA